MTMALVMVVLLLSIPQIGTHIINYFSNRLFFAFLAQYNKKITLNKWVQTSVRRKEEGERILEI